MPHFKIIQYQPSFPRVVPSLWVGYPRVTHPSATIQHSICIECWTVRLACVRHAASVRPEPGSNSPYKVISLLYNEEVDSLIVLSKLFRVSSLAVLVV